MARRRKWLVPETVQTSAMDCGPACLASLMSAHGLAVNYPRLREACQTSLDGTSIDRLEEIANSMGMEAEQTLTPADHLFTRCNGKLPAIAVTTALDGAMHFVVIWRRHGSMLQVMDPRVGRRWLSETRLARELYQHTLSLPAETWRAWAGTSGFLLPLQERLQRLRVPRALIAEWLEQALADPAWEALASLDAAVRMCKDLLQNGALGYGEASAEMIRTLWRCARTKGMDAVIPNPYRSVQQNRQVPSELLISGAVLLVIQGAHSEPPVAERDPELQPVLQEFPKPGLKAILVRLWQAQGGHLGILSAVLCLSALFTLVEGLALRGFIHIAEGLRIFEQRLGLAALLIAVFSVLLIVEFLLQSEILRFGRRFDLSVRIDYLAGIKSTGLRYFQSRPVSDLCQRFHIAHVLRTLPALLAQVLRYAATIAAIGVSLVWLTPGSATIVCGVVVMAVAIPLSMQGLIGEYDLRFRTHAGALCQYYLDALLGADAVRAHGAQANLMNAHENLLTEWKRTGLHLLYASLVVMTADALAGFGLIAAFLWQHLRHEPNAGALLLVFWAFGLPALGQSLAQSLRQYPTLKNVLVRLLEPVRPPDGKTTADNAAAQAPVPLHRRTLAPAPGLRWSAVSIKAGGNTLLENLDLSIPAGAHVAVVGRSGAGKSTLIGSLMGWHTPSRGEILVDGQPLDPVRLRARCAWVDPAVALWDESLLDNLLYGNQNQAELRHALADAALHAVLRRCENGLQTRLGEGGGRLSGGEGQRVRLGRGRLRRQPGIVLLDEALRGLDGDLRDAILPRMRQVWRHATLLHVTHRMREALEFPRVLVFDEGRVVEDGCPHELVRNGHSAFRDLLETESHLLEAVWREYGWSSWTIDAAGHLAIDGDKPAAVTALRGTGRL